MNVLFAVSAEPCPPPGPRFQETTSIPESSAWKAGTLHADSGLAVEGILSSRGRSQNAQGNLSHRQKRHFPITEKGSLVTLNASLAGKVFDPVSDRRLHFVLLNQ
jgi:hypothetical protein